MTKFTTFGRGGLFAMTPEHYELIEPKVVQVAVTIGNHVNDQHWLTELRFYIPLDTKYVTSRILFSANLLAGTNKKQRSKTRITTKIYNKPRLTEHK